MRLICTVTDSEQLNPYEFSYYLKSQGIENTCEEVPENGTFAYRIWVHEEDHVEKALVLYHEYQSSPNDPRYKVHSHFVNHIQQEEPTKENEINPGGETNRRQRRFLSPAPYGPVTLFILLTVITLFMFAQIQRGSVTAPKIPGVIQAPMLSSTEKKLLYDYPSYFILRDQLFKIYTPQDIEEKKAPPSDVQRLLDELKKTPVWMGFYDQLSNYFRNDASPLKYQGPLFEKVRQGELWRLFTPVLLHLDLLHIFFNVLWFILLGNQIEFRLGFWRYLLLILITAVVSNTAQYLVSGPFFMGLSGVVVGMAAFIWARQQVAPWEGYLLHRFTLIFLAIFVIGMFLLQIALFFIQIFGKFGFAIGIANTAHLTGALIGYLLGRIRLFALNPKLK